MARPYVPDSEKRRTVPLRLNKPQYRALSALGEVTGETIQEQLREATKDYLSKKRAELGKDDVTFPSEYWLGEMSDAEFQKWLDSHGARPKEPVRRKPGGFARKEAAAAA